MAERRSSTGSARRPTPTTSRPWSLFHEDYVNTMPVHPSRSFSGNDQVRRNWTAMFASVPDIEVEVLQSAE